MFPSSRVSITGAVMKPLKGIGIHENVRQLSLVRCMRLNGCVMYVSLGVCDNNVGANIWNYWTVKTGVATLSDGARV